MECLTPRALNCLPCLCIESGDIICPLVNDKCSVFSMLASLHDGGCNSLLKNFSSDVFKNCLTPHYGKCETVVLPKARIVGLLLGIYNCESMIEYKA